MSEQLFFEDVKEPVSGVFCSDVRLATITEIEQAKKLHEQGCCPHTIVTDTAGYMYDIRNCAICGLNLGLV